MAIEYTKLPVYEQKKRILDTLEQNQVIVVQSPTGSGKTTQIPVILHEAGYSEKGVIAVTQPRRIAALSVSEFIAKQLGTSYPGLVGYKMRFEDKTDLSTKIKIMTDGILLQEMKLDPMMMKYSVIMVDEAHERSLNIDFVLGLLKRILEVRHDLKIVVSSATMNAEAFSEYFGGCPIVTIDTVTYPVAMIYDPPEIPVSTVTDGALEALLVKIETTISRVLDNDEDGDILVFLPGEKAIRDCMTRLATSNFSRRLHIIPLYGRLPKEEQERVFEKAPFGRKKVVLSTNIAETSVTINGITTVIDSGLAKLNFYNPTTFTSSLIECKISKASCSQRRGRAGRTRPGTCYRLYSKYDFENREEYTTEEIFRTDLSEVVLRMAELGIREFEKFNFISQPSREGIRSAVETLKMLKALNDDHTLSSIGKLMVSFPLMPRVSRIIVEAMLRYPDVLEEAVIAAAFLSTHSPFILPPGEEMAARQAHHAFNDIQGDFVSYVKLYRIYEKQDNKKKFCEKHYLDDKVMAEIENIVLQLSQIISDQNIPISKGGSMSDYLCCIASGMIQFVCIRESRDNFRSLTADHISIHPGSSMFRTDPLYIVAGEIVRTSRMFAMSVSPLTKGILGQIDEALEANLNAVRRQKNKGDNSEESLKAGRLDKKGKRDKEDDSSIDILGYKFQTKKIKGKAVALFPSDIVVKAAADYEEKKISKKTAQSRGKVIYPNGYELMSLEKVSTILTAAKLFNLSILDEKAFSRNENVDLSAENAGERLCNMLKNVMRVAVAKKKSKELGFITAYTDGSGNYWCKLSRGISTAISESLSTIDTLADNNEEHFTDEQKELIGSIYARLNSFYR